MAILGFLILVIFTLWLTSLALSFHAANAMFGSRSGMEWPACCLTLIVFGFYYLCWTLSPFHIVMST